MPFLNTTAIWEHLCSLRALTGEDWWRRGSELQWVQLFIVAQLRVNLGPFSPVCTSRCKSVPRAKHGALLQPFTQSHTPVLLCWTAQITRSFALVLPSSYSTYSDTLGCTG